MEEKTIICDLCKERIARKKCFFCEKDVCEKCRGNIKYDLYVRGQYLVSMEKNEVCEKCEILIKQIKDKIVYKKLDNKIMEITFNFFKSELVKEKL